MVASGTPLAQVCCVDDSDSYPSSGPEDLHLEAGSSFPDVSRYIAAGAASIVDNLDFLFGSIREGRREEGIGSARARWLCWRWLASPG